MCYDKKSFETKVQNYFMVDEDSCYPSGAGRFDRWRVSRVSGAADVTRDLATIVGSFLTHNFRSIIFWAHPYKKVAFSNQCHTKFFIQSQDGDNSVNGAILA